MSGVKRVFVAVPCHGVVVPAFMETLYAAMAGARAGGVQCDLCMLKGESFIARARNNLLALFWQRTDYDYLCFLDSDLELVQCGGGGGDGQGNLFTRLVGHGLPFVGGLYAARKVYGRDPEGRVWRHCTSVLADGRTPGFGTGLHRVRWLSGGCWLLERGAVGAMWERYRGLEYDGSLGLAGHKVCGLFSDYVDAEGRWPVGCYGTESAGVQYLSEDYAFCQRWLDMGGEIWADSGVLLRHWGYQPFDVWPPGVATAAPATGEAS